MKLLLLSIVVGVFLVGPAFADPPDAVLATLGRTPVRESDFNSFLQGMFASEERTMVKSNSTARSEALEAYLDLVVLAAKARRDGLDRSPAYRQARELMEMKLLAKLLTEQERERFTRAAAVTDREVRDFYDRHPERYLMTPQFTVRQVLVYVKGNPAFPDQGHDDAEAAALAQKALARLRAGESWERVAQECSDDPATGRRGGLLENAQFGYFPPEMEAAVRRQEIGRPGEVVKSQFGYHVLQVERRTTERERQPFASVKESISAEVSNEKINAAHQDYMNPIRDAVKLKETPLTEKDTFVLNPPGIKPDDVLATLDGAVICEADFEWFARDAFRLEQRERAFSRPGARIGMVKSYLNMRALEARARQLGFDKTADYQAVCKVEEMKLLGAFLQERDNTTPWKLPGSTEAARATALKTYLDRLRAEMDFKILPVR